MRRVAVAGAGPAGAYFAYLLAGLRPELIIDLYEPRTSVPGAGVVLEQRVLDVHRQLFAGLDSQMRRWNKVRVQVGVSHIVSGGHDIVGLGRSVLLNRLMRLIGQRPNIHIVPERLARTPPEYDLVVAADGAYSTMRSLGDFGTQLHLGRSHYLWLSTPARLPAMFALFSLQQGTLVVHAYPHSTGHSTLVLEADPAALAVEGLDRADLPSLEHQLAHLLHDLLDGESVRLHTYPWRPFTSIHNRRWRDGKIILIGDAAHSMHFSAGMGTELALADASCLANAIATGKPGQYEIRRRELTWQAELDARASRTWFEQLAQYQGPIGHHTVFALRTRRNVNSFASLRLRDPAFVAAVMAELVTDSGLPPASPGAEPSHLPISIGPLLVHRRVVSTDMEKRTVPRRPILRFCRKAGHVVLTDTQAAAETVARGALVTDIAAPAQEWQGADFIAVPSQPFSSRVLRTELAAAVRRRTGLPVLLLDPCPPDLDEVNTLIAARRIDLYAHLDALP
ncbi:FAD-dependent monooxygenase [Nonomuraea sp. NPDC049695]|uniref:FAD-dependent monooxygenase n=1 Tax=Nonomuraea sp. NPDC049695 TaxID=3154734 RepID=UPI00344A442D